jgi:pyridoxamine 5'-phosphate oxidase
MSVSEHGTIRSELRNLKVLEGPAEKCDFSTFPPAPDEAFRKWLKEAIEAGVKEPHAMTLSTVDEDGCPDARILILKNVDARGWHFAIKGNSLKGVQLASNPNAALTFYWPDQGRQIRIRGKAVALPDNECEQDFADRPLSSKIAALGSKQSQVLQDVNEIEMNMESARREFEDNAHMVLPDWKVYAVLPRSVEFWQGSKDRLHQRLQYRRDSAGQRWEKLLLWP